MKAGFFFFLMLFFLTGALPGGLAFPPAAQGAVLVFSPYKEARASPLFGKIPPLPFPEKKVRRMSAIAAEANKKGGVHIQVLTALYNIGLEDMAAVLNSRAANEAFAEGAGFPKRAPQIQESGILPEELGALYAQSRGSALPLINFIGRRGLSPKQTVLVLLPLLRDKSLPEKEALSALVPVISHFGLSPGERLSVRDIAAMFPQAPDGAAAQRGGGAAWENMEAAKLEPQETAASFAHLAAISGRKKLLAALYGRKGFDPNLRDAAGRSPLHSLFAAEWGRRASAKEWEELISAIQKNPETDFNLKDAHGLTPIGIASLNGLAPAVRILSEIPEVDLNVMDHYERTLPIIASTSKSPKRREITRFLLQKGGESLAKVSGLNDYITESLDPVTLAAPHPLESAKIHAAGFLSRQEPQNPEDSERLQKYSLLLRQALEIRSSIDSSLKESGGGYEDRHFLAKAIERSDLDFVASYQDQKAARKERNFLTEDFLFFVLYSGGPSENPSLQIFRGGNFLLSAIEKNDPDMTGLLLEILKSERHIFRPSPESFPEPPWEDIQMFFSGAMGEEPGQAAKERISEEAVFMDPLSEALLASAAIQSEAQVENRDLEMKKSRKILEALTHHSSSDLFFRNFMDLTPMETAVLTGNLDVAVELQKKGVPFPAAEGLWGANAPLREIARDMGFRRLAKHLDEAAPDLKGAAARCRSQFFH